MDEERARALLQAERARVEGLLAERVASEEAARAAGQGPGDLGDQAEPLTSEEIDDAVASGLRERLYAIGRAEKRLVDGSYGKSIASGEPIPDERLEADPAAELTVQEASRRRN